MRAFGAVWVDGFFAAAFFTSAAAGAAEEGAENAGAPPHAATTAFANDGMSSSRSLLNGRGIARRAMTSLPPTETEKDPLTAGFATLTVVDGERALNRDVNSPAFRPNKPQLVHAKMSTRILSIGYVPNDEKRGGTCDELW